MRRAPRCSSP